MLNLGWDKILGRYLTRLLLDPLTMSIRLYSIAIVSSSFKSIMIRCKKGIDIVLTILHLAGQPCTAFKFRNFYCCSSHLHYHLDSLELRLVCCSFGSLLTPWYCTWYR